MRVDVALEEIKVFLAQAHKNSALTFAQIAKVVNLHPRTLRDWSRGKYKPKLEVLEKIAKQFKITLPPINRHLDDFWYTVEGGKIGGRKVMEKYGLVNHSQEARIRAAKKAMKTRMESGDKFYAAKEIIFPKESESFAEFIGIVLGDGGVSSRQVIITLNKKDDKEFSQYVYSLIKSLFGVKAAIIERESTNSIVISRTKLVDFLKGMGLCIGSKVRQQVDVPEWIKNNFEFRKACARGLLDTDGCFYLDRHRYKDKIYINCALNFTNRSKPLLNFFIDTLNKVGLHPTQTSRYSLALRREEEIIKYFRIIGSSNAKHFRKFTNYCINKYGEVPKWS